MSVPALHLPHFGRPFWSVWTASTISSLGSGISYVAFPLLAASYTRDPRLVAAVNVAFFLPMVLVGLQTGALADRRDRRRLMWGTDVVRVGLYGALALLASHGNIGLLCGLALLMGTADIAFNNASAALVPDLVTVEQREAANSWLASGQLVMSDFVGLPLGAVLFATSAGLPFGLDALSFAVAAALVAALPGSYRADRSAEPPTTMRDDVREGMAWLWQHRLLRRLALLLGAMNGAFAAAEATLVLYALEQLHLGESGYGLLLLALAGGALVGSAVAAQARRRCGDAATIRLSCVGMVVAVTLPGLAPSLPVVVLALALGGLTSMTWNITTITLRQGLVPTRLLGRVTSAYRLVGLGVMPLGAAAGGFLAHSYGLRAPWLVGGIFLAVTAALLLPRIRRADVEQAVALAA